MIAYATHTGTHRNLAALCAAGWSLLYAPPFRRRLDPRFPYGLDNGAWSAFASAGRHLFPGEPLTVIMLNTTMREATSAFARVCWSAPAFERHVADFGASAEFIVVPDIVAGGAESLSLTRAWLPRLEGIGRRRLVAVQDGMTDTEIAPLLSPEVGVFVGGTTEWKIATMRAWGRLARRHGAYLHIGRVNSARRIRYCADAGADSFDGTSVTRFAVTLPLLDNTRRQGHMFGGLDA